MPCRAKPSTKKVATKKERKPKNGQKTSKQNKSQATKENRYITDYFPTVSRRVLAAQSKLDEYNKQIKHYIETQTDPIEKLVVTEFDNKGKGIVSATNFKKDCFICEYSGDLIKLDAAKSREAEYALSGAGCYMYYFKWNKEVWCVDATKPTGRYGRLINHSRKAPNCKTKVFEYNGNPRLIFIALRDIDINEEILYDYGERDPHAIRSNPWLTST